MQRFNDKQSIKIIFKTSFLNVFYGGKGNDCVVYGSLLRMFPVSGTWNGSGNIGTQGHKHS